MCQESVHASRSLGAFTEKEMNNVDAECPDEVATQLDLSQWSAGSDSSGSFINTDGSEKRTQPKSPQAKKGHICLGFLCDMRRCVVALNFFTMMCFLVAAVSLTCALPHFESQHVDDDFLVHEDMRPIVLCATIVAYSGIAFNFLAIWGAIIYNAGMVLLNAAWFWGACISVATLSYRTSQQSEIFSYSWISLFLHVAFTTLLSYPSIFLAYEIHVGIMSPRTYTRREEHSCCCV
jgi:hypothetical protein